MLDSDSNSSFLVSFKIVWHTSDSISGLRCEWFVVFRIQISIDVIVDRVVDVAMFMGVSLLEES